MFLELFGVLFGFVYLYLEIKQKRGMWAVGLVMAVVYSVVYWKQEVYASMAFQIYYVLVSIYGFLMWGKDKIIGKDIVVGKNDETEQAYYKILYRKLTNKVALWSILVYCVATAFMVGVLGKYTGDPMPFADSSVTVLSAIATFWLSKSYREQWLVWLLVNGVTVIMTFNLKLYPTSVLYAVNAAASVYGYFHWKRNGKEI